MIKRDSEDYPKGLRQRFQSVTMIGPKQSGKTTLGVRLISNIKDLSLFQRFVSLCAGRTGQILNKESISADVGINVKTVEEWLSVLEASFLILRVQPFWANTRKRLIKSPKIFFYDTGLVSWLLNIRGPSDTRSHPIRGQIFEFTLLIYTASNILGTLSIIYYA